MVKMVNLVRIDGEFATFSWAPAIMAGLKICPGQHLLSWPQFAVTRRWTRWTRRTDALEISEGDVMTVVTGSLMLSRSWIHRFGISQFVRLPHEGSWKEGFWTGARFRPEVLILAQGLRMVTVEGEDPIEVIGALEYGPTVWQGAGRRVLFVTDTVPALPHNVEGSRCPYCNAPDWPERRPDYWQGHLLVWRLSDEVPDWEPGLRTRMFNHWFRARSAGILGDPRRSLVWSKAPILIESWDHPALELEPGLWALEHPVPRPDVD